MTKENKTSGKRIAILGCGPAGLFMYKRLIESGEKNLEISIFERKMQAGAGMPYSKEGANDEHITNVSDNEIPTIVTSIEEWVKTAPKELLAHFKIDPQNFNEYKVLPRLFFGEYLSAQFDLLHKTANDAGISAHLHFGKIVTDIIDQPNSNEVKITAGENEVYTFDAVIICTGHNWPKKFEGKIPGCFDSPYPPSKLATKFDHAIAIKGASLTAIDALRTLARSNGVFTKEENGRLSFGLAEGSENFRVVMHSRNGLLPALRFHLEDFAFVERCITYVRRDSSAYPAKPVVSFHSIIFSKMILKNIYRSRPGILRYDPRDEYRGVCRENDGAARKA